MYLYTSEEVRYWFYVRYSNEQIINWRTMDNNNNNCFVCQLLNIIFYSGLRYHETILLLYFETTCVCMWWCGKFLGKFLIKVKSFLAHYVRCRNFFFHKLIPAIKIQFCNKIPCQPVYYLFEYYFKVCVRYGTPLAI